MKLLSNPAVVALLGVLSGTAVGLGWFMKASNAIIEHAIASQPPPPEPEGKEQGWDFWTIEIDGLSNELKDEKARLRQQAELLDQRAARLASEQQELAKVRTEIEAMRSEINRKFIEVEADEMKNIKTLASTYSNLTPKAAVAILREMDDITVVKILSLMKADVVGPIFEEMTKLQGPDGPLAKRAAALSEKLRLMKAVKKAS